MKNLILLLLLLVAGRVVAQNIAASGMVANNYGQPVRYAFIFDPQTKNAVYTDSTGVFKLVADPTSQLTVNANGYLAIKVGAQASLQLTLQADPNAIKIPVKTGIDEAFKTINGYFRNSAHDTQGSMEGGSRDVVGSRFLFTRWVPGYLVSIKDSIIQNPKILYNYDKTTGDLYYNDNGKVVIIAKNSIKGFVLINLHDKPVVFEAMTGISSDLYSTVICSGPNYKIYKLITTKYIVANLQSDGLTTTGNNYDEYADNYTYYVMDMKTLAYQPLLLRKKSIKEVFASEGNKLENFMNTHSSATIDENYLVALGAVLNQ